MLGMVAAMMVMVMGLVDRDLWAPAAIRKGKVWEKVMGKMVERVGERVAILLLPQHPKCRKRRSRRLRTNWHEQFLVLT
jgi:cytochrome c-type biogenesis protein CcmH/NrfF